MKGTSDVDDAGQYPGEGVLDPQGAATLLAHTQRRTKEALDFRSPLLSLFAALVALVAFGAIWLSVRGQHPYTGPTAVSLVVVYAAVLARIGSVVYAHRRAQAGVSGHSVRQRRAEGAALGAVLVAVYLVAAALSHAGASNAIVWGVYVITAPLIVMGTFWAGRSAVREDWQGLGVAVAIVLVAAGSAFAGPRGVWLSDGIGCCVVLLVAAAVRAWLLRPSRSDV